MICGAFRLDQIQCSGADILCSRPPDNLYTG